MPNPAFVQLAQEIAPAARDILTKLEAGVETIWETRKAANAEMADVVASMRSAVRVLGYMAENKNSPEFDAALAHFREALLDDNSQWL